MHACAHARVHLTNDVSRNLLRGMRLVFCMLYGYCDVSLFMKLLRQLYLRAMACMLTSDSGQTSVQEAEETLRPATAR